MRPAGDFFFIQLSNTRVLLAGYAQCLSNSGKGGLRL